MRLLCLSDIHGDWSPVAGIISEVKPEMIFITGDCQTFVPLDVAAYVIQGNHEDWDLWNDLLLGKLKIRNINPLPNGRITTVFHGNISLKIASLGGVEAKRPRKPSHFSEKDFQALLAEDYADVLLTHEAPKPLWHGSVKITTLIEKLKPSVAISGHVHAFQAAIYNNTSTLIVNVPPVLHGYVTLEIETDERIKVRDMHYHQFI